MTLRGYRRGQGHSQGEDIAEQDAENYRYWQSLTVGERLIAISELSAGEYGMKGIQDGDDAIPTRILVRVERL